MNNLMCGAVIFYTHAANDMSFSMSQMAEVTKNAAPHEFRSVHV